MDTILIIIVLLILFGGFGGGYYGYSHYGMGGGIGILGVVLIIAAVLFVFGRGARIGTIAAHAFPRCILRIAGCKGSGCSPYARGISNCTTTCAANTSTAKEV